MKYSGFVRQLPPDLQIFLADVGSAGGIHKRWTPIRDHVTAILFDPLDPSTGSARDIYLPVALASSKGQATLNVTKRVSMTSTLLPNTDFLGRFWDKPEHTMVESTLAIPTDRFDSVVEQEGLTPDIIKIDVQGGEYDILLGAVDTLRNTLFFAEIEVSFVERYAGLKPFADIVAFMESCGYDLIDISRIKRYRYRNSFGIAPRKLSNFDSAGRLAFCDALFMLKDEILAERLSKEAAYFPLKAMLVMLAYGKPDRAAWIFDMASNGLDPVLREALARDLRDLAKVSYHRRGMHKLMNFLARRL